MSMTADPTRAATTARCTVNQMKSKSMISASTPTNSSGSMTRRTSSRATSTIFYADLEPVIGSEQGGVRPVLVIQNDIGNRHSPTVIVAAITSRIKHRRQPTHVNLNGRQCGLHSDSTIMLEQLRTLDKQRLLGYVGSVGKAKMDEVDRALEISVGTSKKPLPP